MRNYIFRQDAGDGFAALLTVIAPSKAAAQALIGEDFDPDYAKDHIELLGSHRLTEGNVYVIHTGVEHEVDDGDEGMYT